MSNEEDLSFIDNWMSEAKSSTTSASISLNDLNGEGKMGLGYNPSLSKSKKDDQQNILLKKKKEQELKQKKVQELNLKRKFKDSHGLIEDDGEEFESRSALVNKTLGKKENQDNKKKAKVEKVISTSTRNDKNSNNKDNTTTNSTNSSNMTSYNQTEFKELSEDKLTRPERPDFFNNNKDKGKNYWKNYKAESYTLEDGTVIKTKRPKTRSKQKNIRKDNRAPTSKPSYLTDINDKNYRGRELTQETKNILGISDIQKKKKNKKKNKNNNNENKKNDLE